MVIRRLSNIIQLCDSELTQDAKDYMAGVGYTEADGSLAVGWKHLEHSGS